MARYTGLAPVIQDIKNRGSIIMITRRGIITSDRAIGGDDLPVSWDEWGFGIGSPLFDHVTRASARAVAYGVIHHHGPVVDFFLPVVMRRRSWRHFRCVLGELQRAEIVFGGPFAQLDRAAIGEGMCDEH